MPGFLKQATAAQSRAIGPFLDDTDFKTAETGLTIANTDIKLVVNGGASANKNSGGGTHRINGVYGVTFDATDTATVGEMEVSVVVAGALPVFDKFFVVEEAVYDQLFAASALGYIANAPVNVAQFGGSNLTSASGIPEVKVASIAANAITATAINADAITDAKVAADVTIASVTGSVGSVTGAVGSVTGAVGSVTGNVGGNVVGSVASVTARVTANVDQINADATSAANLAKTTRAIARGTVTAGASTTSIPTSAFTPAGAVADQFKGRIITFDADTTTTALRGQSTDITASTNAATPTFTVTALTSAPASGDTFSVT
jgi:hypothetical protein